MVRGDCSTTMIDFCRLEAQYLAADFEGWYYISIV
jgi:hypothetical protein